MHSFGFYLRNPKVIWSYILYKYCAWMPDKLYLKLYFPCKMGYKLDLKHPRTYSEKLQWLKLYDRKEIYSKMVDKYDVKDYVASIIGEKYIIPTLGMWEQVEDIDWDNLPNKFVLKCTHDSGGLVICKDKAALDKELAITKIKNSLNTDYYLIAREWPYKNVAHRIIAEQYIEPDSESKDLPDYKFFCFNGEVKALFIATERQNPNEEVKFDFFDADFNHLPFRQGHDHAKNMPSKPMNFELMKELAAKLSKGIPQVRVDFYEVGGKVLFGEMTFFHFGGLMPFEPVEWDYILGDLIELPEK